MGLIPCPATSVKSLEGYPLEWCTADFDTAQTQLKGGDFYVYYSINEAGEAIIPRLAIRLEDEHVAEARGIAPDQNLDPYYDIQIGGRTKDQLIKELKKKDFIGNAADEGNEVSDILESQNFTISENIVLTTN